MKCLKVNNFCLNFIFLNWKQWWNFLNWNILEKRDSTRSNVSDMVERGDTLTDASMFVYTEHYVTAIFMDKKYQINLHRSCVLLQQFFILTSACIAECNVYRDRNINIKNYINTLSTWMIGLWRWCRWQWALRWSVGFFNDYLFSWTKMEWPFYPKVWPVKHLLP